MDPVQSDITQWLHALQRGQRPQASSALFKVPYNELRCLARGHLRREIPGHTLGATCLAHAAWFRMAEQSRTHWQNRNHFLGVASTMMRRILVNHELARRTDKRQAQMVSPTLARLEEIGAAPDRDIVAVQEARLDGGTHVAGARAGRALSPGGSRPTRIAPAHWRPRWCLQGSP